MAAGTVRGSSNDLGQAERPSHVSRSGLKPHGYWEPGMFLLDN